MEIFKNESLYDKMINYAKSVVYKNKSNICHIDLVHDLILEKEITESNYIQEIKSLFLIERRIKDKNTDVTDLAFEWHGTKTAENVYSTPCKRCQESYPVDFFRKRTLKNGFVQIYYICKKCESKDVTTRLRKIDPKIYNTPYIGAYALKIQLANKQKELANLRERLRELSYNKNQIKAILKIIEPCDVKVLEKNYEKIVKDQNYGDSANYKLGLYYLNNIYIGRKVFIKWTNPFYFFNNSFK